ncbi:MAG: vWA domain-containing protein [Aureliella sp.]
MNFIPMLAWWQWLIVAAVPPLIVLLYFLKLRRQPVEVPSTFLWRRAVEDLHVNSIWQRLRRNLLLLLQLIAVALFMLALLRPGMSGTTKLGARSIFLIDNSASMQATDVGGSRLREAKKLVLERIDALGDDDVAMIIAFSNAADVRQGFTGDRRRLREAVDKIQPTNHTTDINEALRAAAGLANPGRTSQVKDLETDLQVAEAMPASLYVVSDGGFPQTDFQLGNLEPQYLPVGSTEVNNVAVLAFTADRNLEKPDHVEAFARVRNFGNAAVTLTASLYLNDELVDASELTLEPKGETGASFQLSEVEQGRLKIELGITDDFELDNTAYAGLDPPRQLQVVLVTPGNTALETALTTSQAQTVAAVATYAPESLETPELQQLAASGKVDLFIYDRCAPKMMPAANTLFFGSIPPGEGWKAEPSTGPVFVIDSNRAHPIMQYVDMTTVRIVEGMTLTPPEGSTTLIRSDAGVLMAVAPREAFQDAVLGMALVKAGGDGDVPNTDWPIKRSFPVFLLNCLEYLGGAVSTSGSKSIQPGEPAVLSLASRFDQVKVVDPAKQTHILERGGAPQLTYNRTDEFGFYRVEPTDGDRLLQLFTVNLFSERESSIAVPADIMLGEVEVKAAEARETVRHEYWRWLLALALVVLVLEWILYTRRVAV